MKKTLKIAIVGSWLLTLLALGIHEFSAVEIDLNAKLVLLLATLSVNLLYLFFTFIAPMQGEAKPFLSLTLSLFLCLALLFMVSADTDWKTQTILFEHKESKASIEFQMKGIGARGYLRRTVEMTRYLYIISLPKEVDIKNLDPFWQPVNIEVNEIGLKGG